VASTTWLAFMSTSSEVEPVRTQAQRGQSIAKVSKVSPSAVRDGAAERVRRVAARAALGPVHHVDWHRF
jgi:hypothetical protein